eukprot:15351876-Ditylum_brightwellii.AAC.2
MAPLSGAADIIIVDQREGECIKLVNGIMLFLLSTILEFLLQGHFDALANDGVELLLAVVQLTPIAIGQA